MISALNYEEIGKHPERISKLEKHSEKYNWKGLEFPMKINEIGKFEKANPDISVNVLCEEGKEKIFICRKSKFNERSKIINLLLIVDGEKKHYTAIKSLSRLLRSENTRHTEEQHFCINCLQGFSSTEARDNHFEYCKDNEAVKIEMPLPGSKVKFHKGQNQFKVPFIMYADFESILKKVDKWYVKRQKYENGEKSYTEKINKHIPSGFCVYSKFAYGEIEDPMKVYRGKDCVEVFCEYIEKEAQRLFKSFPEKKMIPLTKEEWREYDKATKCHICLEEFDEIEDEITKGIIKVRDHCHYTGKYRGPAHSNCNLRYKIPSYIPIVFHNLSGYDAHLFIRELGKKFDTGKIGVIAENKEKYITFNVDVVVEKKKDKKTGKERERKIQLRFIDSVRFMASSLDELSASLKDDQCENLRWFYGEGENFKLMRRKGIYPYEYIDSWERFDETKLPPKEKFYSKLNMKGITDKDYEHAQEVWNRITPKQNEITLGDYHDVYLATDVLLLADVFETFRKTCLNHYGLDPAHFYTSPGLSWEACLKKTGVELELLTDHDMLLMFEKGIRGGIVQAVHRYAKANNKYMGQNYNPEEEESSYLQYLDANNLYGWAMTQNLPVGGFKWIENVERFNSSKMISRLVEKLIRKDMF